MRGGEEVNRTIDICVHVLSQTMTGQCYTDHKISPTNKNDQYRSQNKKQEVKTSFPSLIIFILNNNSLLFIVILVCFMPCIIIHYFEYPDVQ